MTAADRRAALAAKARRVVAACDPADLACAEGFARHHAARGEHDVVADLAAFLDAEAARLRLADPDGRLPAVERLARLLADLRG